MPTANDDRSLCTYRMPVAIGVPGWTDRTPELFLGPPLATGAAMIPTAYSHPLVANKSGVLTI
jgi:hypothetical protein